MPETDIGQAVVTNITGTIQDFSVPPATLDSPTDQKETTWINSKWSEYYGYYSKMPELKRSINVKVSWILGKGIKADEATTMLLDTIKGNGKDTFRGILKNALTVKEIGGDSYAEIIRSKEEVLINLKPLAPDTIQHVFGRNGRFLRFEQIDRTNGKTIRKFMPEEIFYLAKNRIADEMHGNTDIEAVKDIILRRNEAITDWKRVLHRNVDPIVIIHADTDEQTKLDKIKADWEKIKREGETWIVPKGVIVPEFVSVAPNATLNPVTWIEMQNDVFYETIGTPKVIIGNSKNFTDASSKIVYLGYEQTIKEEQLELEEQVLSQLNLVIKLPPPASLESGLLSGTENDEMDQVNPPEIEQEQAMQPNDTTAEVEGNR